MRKAYTKRGDSGFTRDRSGRRLPKDHPSILRVGQADSLQSAVGLALLTARGKTRAMLREVRDGLWKDASPRDLARLETFIDSLGEPPQGFIRFTGLRALRYDECRVRCRQLESACAPLLRSGRMKPAAYAWLNRLSSLFFMLAVRASRR